MCLCRRKYLCRRKHLRGRRCLQRSGHLCRKNVAAGDCVEVLCFHGKQRCATCIAIERNTREVLEKEFAFGNARKSPDTFKAGLVKRSAEC